MNRRTLRIGLGSRTERRRNTKTKRLDGTLQRRPRVRLEEKIRAELRAREGAK